jgi:hypothetical protein
MKQPHAHKIGKVKRTLQATIDELAGLGNALSALYDRESLLQTIEQRDDWNLAVDRVKASIMNRSRELGALTAELDMLREVRQVKLRGRAAQLVANAAGVQ